MDPQESVGVGKEKTAGKKEVENIVTDIKKKKRKKKQEKDFSFTEQNDGCFRNV